MYHSIRPKNEEPGEPSAINADTFYETIHLAEQLGFETITTEEFLAFLTENAKIPLRSMILILDDRKPGTAEDYFLPVLQENNWTATLAWIVGDTDQRLQGGRLKGESLWGWIERLNNTGYFDIQAHGLNHIPLTEQISSEEMRIEIEGGIAILSQHFGKEPIAYIWPGGDYTDASVRIAREAGFEIGFTVQSRGPVMFNWIPQGERELAVNDPLMVLPRFWSSAAVLNLRQAAETGIAAREFAEQNYQVEADWYQAYCGGQLPALADVLK
jgi:peptidoglycan/xylan/chitin deacetylase (PgdA/CDA1 family)